MAREKSSNKIKDHKQEEEKHKVCRDSNGRFSSKSQHASVASSQARKKGRGTSGTGPRKED